jgi:hypothetical protein
VHVRALQELQHWQAPSKMIYMGQRIYLRKAACNATTVKTVPPRQQQ